MLRMSPSNLNLSSSPKAPTAHASGGRLPIAAFMTVAAPILAAPVMLLSSVLEGLLDGISTAMDKGLEDIGNQFSRSNKD